MKKSVVATVDRYAALALKRAAIEAEMKELRPAILDAGNGLDFLFGKKHVLSINHSNRVSLSVPLAKSVMTAAQIAEATVVSDITTITVER